MKEIPDTAKVAKNLRLARSWALIHKLMGAIRIQATTGCIVLGVRVHDGGAEVAGGCGSSRDIMF